MSYLRLLLSFCLVLAAWGLGHYYGQRGADRWYAAHQPKWQQVEQVGTYTPQPEITIGQDTACDLVSNDIDGFKIHCYQDGNGLRWGNAKHESWKASKLPCKEDQ